MKLHLYQTRAVSPISEDSEDSDQGDNVAEKAISSTQPSKRGRTEDDDLHGKGGKKARRVSLSAIFYISINEATLLSD